MAFLIFFRMLLHKHFLHLSFVIHIYIYVDMHVLQAIVGEFSLVLHTFRRYTNVVTIKW